MRDLRLTLSGVQCTFIARIGCGCMARPRIPAGTAGPVTVAPIGYRVDDPTKKQVAIPAPRSGDNKPLPYPRGWRTGDAVKVGCDLGEHAFVITQWRGLLRVCDLDGAQYMVRRKKLARSAAESATRRAGLDLLATLAQRRQDSSAAAAEAQRLIDAGDTATTMRDLVARVFASPDFARLAPKTRQDYEYAAKNLLADPIADLLPRHVDVAITRSFLERFASAHGAGGAKHVRAVLARTLTVATEDSTLRVASNPVHLARHSIPQIKVRETGLDHSRAPTDDEVDALLAESPRRVRRLQSFGRLGSCQEIRRSGIRRSCGSVRCGWWPRSDPSRNRTGRR
jgi:hypothetical protein